jgi:hypothetical protein
MTVGRANVLRWVFLLSLVALSTAPANAVAGPLDSHGFSYLYSDTTAPTSSGSTWQVNYSCNGLAPVGGGVRLQGEPADSWIHSTQPYATPNPPSTTSDYKSWFTAVRNPGPPVAFRDFTICRKSGWEGLEYLGPQIVPVAANTPVTSEVHCPAGTSLLSGGFDAALEVRVNSARPLDDDDGNSRPDDMWQVSAYNAAATQKNLVVYAICIHDASKRLTYEESERKTFTGDTGLLTASCPSSSAVVGGGISISGTAQNSLIHSSYPRDGSDSDDAVDDRWSAVGVSTDGKRKARTYAICFD